MRVLLIATNQYDRCMSRMQAQPLPIGLAYLAGALAASPHVVNTLDLMFSEDPLGDVEQAVRAFQPALVGISIRNISNGSYLDPQWVLPFSKTVIAKVRELTSATIVCGGPAFSILPKAIFAYMEPDFGLAGDAAEAFVQLADRLEADVPCHDLPGMVYHGGPRGPRVLGSSSTVAWRSSRCTGALWGRGSGDGHRGVARGRGGERAEGEASSAALHESRAPARARRRTRTPRSTCSRMPAGAPASRSSVGAEAAERPGWSPAPNWQGRRRAGGQRRGDPGQRPPEAEVGARFSVSKKARRASIVAWASVGSPASRRRRHWRRRGGPGRVVGGVVPGEVGRPGERHLAGGRLVHRVEDEAGHPADSPGSRWV